MGAPEVTLGAKITQGFVTGFGYIKYGFLATGQTIHTALAGPIVNAVSSIWATCGAIGGPIVVVLGTMALANLANRLCHQKLNTKSRIVHISIRILGLALVVLTGAAATAAVAAHSWRGWDSCLCCRCQSFRIYLFFRLG